jgi:hypothetical protein
MEFIIIFIILVILMYIYTKQYKSDNPDNHDNQEHFYYDPYRWFWNMGTRYTPYGYNYGYRYNNPYYMDFLNYYYY